MGEERAELSPLTKTVIISLLALGVFGGAIAVYIVITAWTIARGALDMLMDREMPDEDRTRIRA